MERKLTIIAPTKAIGSGKSLEEAKIKRVASYCRVSTDSDEQLGSLENQRQEWERRLSNDPNIIYVGDYSDEGISGTSDEGRLEFKRMIRDAKAGKIDKIVTKSISRFSRNTLTSIEVARELKRIGVEVYFDNEGISTLNPAMELMFTLGAIIAQEESRHISENVRWAFKKMMQDAFPFLDTTHFLGYDRSEDGKKLVVNEGEAETVRLIFNLYDSGMGVSKICDTLKARGHKTVYGKDTWNTTTITSMLRNEKYVGDLLLQKTYTVDFLSHKRKENTGELQFYSWQNTHEPIISREQWERVQKRLGKKSKKYVGKNRDLHKYNNIYPLSGTLICLECGNTFKRRTWSGSNRVRIKHVYQCNGYINGLEDGTRCTSKPISETLSTQACCDVINYIFMNKSTVFKKVSALIKEALSTEKTTREIQRLIAVKRRLGEEMERLDEQRHNEPIIELKELIDVKRDRVRDQYKAIINDIKALQEQEDNSKGNKDRLDKMLAMLENKKLTPDMVTKEIVEAFIYRIIAIDDENLVFVIDTTHTLSVENLVNQRHEIIKKDPIYSSSITGLDPIKKKTIKYKAVIV